LVREHGGIDHCMTVTGDGYEWNDQTFKSLSSVAKAITGTNWNGHRFFGLKGKSNAAKTSGSESELSRSSMLEAYRS
jgi:Protein of unknown function (DUF2924)